MIAYRIPSLFTVKVVALQIKTQGTVPLTCSGDFPTECSVFSGFSMVSSCFPGIVLEATFFIPGVACADPIVSQCTITVNGQPSGSFCDGFAGVDDTDDCGGTGCAVEFDCAFTVNNCSGGETVEISCPGFKSCTQIAVVVTPA